MNRLQFKNAWLLPVLLMANLVPGMSRAELIVIYDSGASRRIEPYLAPVQPTTNREDSARNTAPVPVLGAADAASWLPLRTPELTPGQVTAKTVELPVPVAFFLIGADKVSLAWLSRHREALKKKGAIGLLVEVASKQELVRIAAIAAGLPIVPGNGKEVAAALGVRHYPFALTDGRIWQ